MISIVPLAGPDFISDSYCKALIPYKGTYLLPYILNSRNWAPNVMQYIFILFDSLQSRSFYSNFLASWYSGSKCIFISSYTRGAALSALAGISLCSDFTQPLVIDLADIDYSLDSNPANEFYTDNTTGAVVPIFSSTEAHYSYISLSSTGDFIRAAEKKVISDNASAGTYFFRNAHIFISSLSYSLEHEAEDSYNSLFYVCPLMNGVHRLGYKVKTPTSKLICDVKSI